MGGSGEPLVTTASQTWVSMHSLLGVVFSSAFWFSGSAFLTSTKVLLVLLAQAHTSTVTVLNMAGRGQRLTNDTSFGMELPIPLPAY